MGRDFLPRGTNIVTRRPLILQLVNTKSLPLQREEEWGEFLHIPNKRFTSFSEIKEEIIKETERETGKGKPIISPKPINLKIHSPLVVNLTLVDLPGICKVSLPGQPEDLEEKIREMVRSYIDRPECIIVAVSPVGTQVSFCRSLSVYLSLSLSLSIIFSHSLSLSLSLFLSLSLTLFLYLFFYLSLSLFFSFSLFLFFSLSFSIYLPLSLSHTPLSLFLSLQANDDISNSEGLKLAREVDPHGERTIGVLTKIDIMDKGTDCLKILSGKVVPLRYGFVGIVNRSQHDINM